MLYCVPGCIVPCRVVPCSVLHSALLWWLRHDLLCSPYDTLRAYLYFSCSPPHSSPTHPCSAELLGVLAGKTATDKYDGNDPVSGRVVFTANGTHDFMTVSFQLNARISRKPGIYNEDGSPSIQVTDEGLTVPVQIDNEPGRFINVVAMTSGYVSLLSLFLFLSLSLSLSLSPPLSLPFSCPMSHVPCPMSHPLALSPFHPPPT